MGNLTAKRSDIKINTTITSAHGSVTPSASMALALRADFDSATSTYQISDTITGSSDTIDLMGGLLDDLSDSATFKKVHLLHYNSTSASSNAMVFSDNFSFTSAVSLVGGAHATYINETGLPITATTNDVITVTGTAGSPYDVVVIGLKP